MTLCPFELFPVLLGLGVEGSSGKMKVNISSSQVCVETEIFVLSSLEGYNSLEVPHTQPAETLTSQGH